MCRTPADLPLLVTFVVNEVSAFLAVAQYLAAVGVLRW
jgi:hypothetical protein